MTEATTGAIAGAISLAPAAGGSLNPMSLLALVLTVGVMTIVVTAIPFLLDPERRKRRKDPS